MKKTGKFYNWWLWLVGTALLIFVRKNFKLVVFGKKTKKRKKIFFQAKI